MGLIGPFRASLTSPFSQKIFIFSSENKLVSLKKMKITLKNRVIKLTLKDLVGHLFSKATNHEQDNTNVNV